MTVTLKLHLYKTINLCVLKLCLELAQKRIFYLADRRCPLVSLPSFRTGGDMKYEMDDRRGFPSEALNYHDFGDLQKATRP